MLSHPEDEPLDYRLVFPAHLSSPWFTSFTAPLAVQLIILDFLLPQFLSTDTLDWQDTFKVIH